MLGKAKLLLSNEMENKAPTMSLIDGSAGSSIGNYKGVMLCNRPFAGTATGQYICK